MAHPRISAFLGGEGSGKLVVFDKDGTLIDFNAMWAGWIAELARRLEAAKSRIENEEWRDDHTRHGQFSITESLFRTMGFDAATGRVIAGSHLALDPMAELRELTVEIVREAGVPGGAAEQIVAASWHPPDPVALARPLADLDALFGALRSRGMRVAVATSDDHAPAVATLAALGLAELVDAVVGADDGVPIKPAPDMILKLCRELGVAPAQVAMVGDSADDLHMGRAGGAGLVVGVLSGLSSAELLEPYADALLPSVAELLA
jgi:phosphoglycolate phosphatase-like HAD superfamily hydrolase